MGEYVSPLNSWDKSDHFIMLKGSILYLITWLQNSKMKVELQEEIDKFIIMALDTFSENIRSNFPSYETN